MNLANQIFELPSKGVVYPTDSPLHRGKIEMHPMTAVEEDVISDPNIQAFGFDTIADELMSSLLVDPVHADTLIKEDRDACMLYTRITAWGSLMEFKKEHPITKKDATAVVDLSKITEKPLSAKPIEIGKNEFEFELPYSGKKLTFKLLTHGDIKSLEEERNYLKKVDPKSRIVTTRLARTIISVDGNYDLDFIKNFILTMYALDVRALDEYILSIKPEITLKADVTFVEDGHVQGGVEIPFVVWDTFLPKWREQYNALTTE